MNVPQTHFAVPPNGIGMPFEGLAQFAPPIKVRMEFECGMQDFPFTDDAAPLVDVPQSSVQHGQCVPNGNVLALLVPSGDPHEFIDQVLAMPKSRLKS